MQVRVVVDVDVPESELDVEGIERAVTAAWRDFPGKAWNAVAREIEVVAERQHQARMHRKCVETRSLWTTAGHVRFTRHRYTDDVEEKSFTLFDMRVGLERYQRATEAAKDAFGRLAAISPSYAKSVQEAEIVVGDSPSRSAIWNWTQEIGEKIEALEKAERKAVFDDGDLPGTDIPPKDFVGVEADSTMVHQWRKKGVNHEVYVGMAYDGKKEIRRRRVLTNRVAVASFEASTVFGRDLFIAAQKKHNVCEAKAVVFSSDGAQSLETVRQEHFPFAPHHLDHRHVIDKAREAYGWNDTAGADAVLESIFAEKRAEFEAATLRNMSLRPDRRAKIAEFREYVLARWDWIFTVRRMKAKFAGLAIPSHISGTGAEERMVAVLVGHRMKRRGMGWTRSGGANIIRVRLRALGLQN